jgi:hypothetical protein
MSHSYATGADAREVLRQTAGLLATDLGAGWSVDNDPRWDGHPGVYLDGPDGVRIVLRMEDKRGYVNAADRFSVSGVYPQGWLQVYTGDLSNDHRATVARDRGLGALSKAVTGRLLPGFLVDLAKVNERVEGHNNHESGKATLAEELRRLAEESGSRQPSHMMGTVFLKDARLEVRGPDNVEVDRLNLTAHGARLFIEFLKQDGVV